MAQGNFREVTRRERKHLAEIGTKGGKSRSHKKLQAVTSNLVLAMRARYPNDPKWNPDLKNLKKGKGRGKGKGKIQLIPKKATKMHNPKASKRSAKKVNTKILNSRRKFGHVFSTGFKSKASSNKGKGKDRIAKMDPHIPNESTVTTTNTPEPTSDTQKEAMGIPPNPALAKAFGKPCFVCTKTMEQGQKLGMRRNPNLHRQVPVHAECQASK